MIAPLVIPDAIQMGKMNLPRRSASKSIPAQNNPPLLAEPEIPSINFGMCKGKNMVSLGAPVIDYTLREFTAWFVPAGYFWAGLVCGVSSLAGEFILEQSLLAISPLWTITVVFHALAKSESMWLWGVLVSFLFPFAALLKDEIAWVCYLLVYSMFASMWFWREFRGVVLIIISLGWIGELVCAGIALAFHGQQLARTGLYLSAGFAILIGIFSSQEVAKTKFRVLSQ